jgi:hypothetical protein
MPGKITISFVWAADYCPDFKVTQKTIYKIPGKVVAAWSNSAIMRWFSQ